MWKEGHTHIHTYTGTKNGDRNTKLNGCPSIYGERYCKTELIKSSRKAILELVSLGREPHTIITYIQPMYT